MADNTQQDDSGIQGLLNTVVRGARNIGHFWAPSLVDAPPKQVAQPEEEPTAAQMAMAQQAAAQAAQQKNVAVPALANNPRFSFTVGATPAQTAQNANAAQQNAYREDFKKNPNAYIWGYRYYEGKDPAVLKKGELETVRTYFPVAEMKPYLDVYKLAKGKFGLPKLTSKELAGMALAESRPDFGYNNWDVNQPHLKKLFAEVKKLAPGISDEQAGFIVALREKNDLAKKLKRSFYETWNGLGVSEQGRTGKQHEIRVKKNMEKAVPHKQNEQLIKMLEDSIARMQAQNAEEVQAAKGGSIHKALQGGSKMI